MDVRVGAANFFWTNRLVGVEVGVASTETNLR